VTADRAAAEARSAAFAHLDRSDMSPPGGGVCSRIYQTINDN
jgi:hypothetical protein